LVIYANVYWFPTSSFLKGDPSLARSPDRLPPITAYGRQNYLFNTVSFVAVLILSLRL